MRTFSFKSRFVSLENGFSIAVLAVMSLLPLLEFAGRLTIGRGIPGFAPLVQNLTLWVTFLGAALAARSDSLLALSTQDFLPGSWRKRVRIFTSAIAAGITAWLLLASVNYVRTFLVLEDQIALGIPKWVALLALPAGFFLITARLIQHASE